MKAKELIPYGLYKKGKSIVRITAIDIVADACRGIDISNGEDTGWFPSDKLSPIPLSPEILEDNGFYISQEYGVCFSAVYSADMGLYYDATQEPYVFDWAEHQGVEIRYVHELQHALRLCGLDDLADNFKVE